MLDQLFDFFVSAWLWGMTGGIYHLPLSLVCLTLALCCAVPKNIVKSFLWSFAAIASSFAVLTLWVVGCISYLAGHVYVPTEPYLDTASFFIRFPGFSLGILYTILEILFWELTFSWHTISRARIVFITIVSNSVAFSIAHYALATL